MKRTPQAISRGQDSRASVLDCGSPLPLSETSGPTKSARGLAQSKTSRTTSRFIASFLLCLLGTLAVSAQTPSGFRAAQLPPPGGVKISLLADKPEFFLGENILLHYHIENTSEQGFGISVGGDYRGGTRANRFKVTVVDAAGRELPDPAPVQHDMGGMSPFGGANPGMVWFESVWLLRYRTLDAPGDYTVTVFHDLGWGERQAKDVRVVTLKLRLKMPNEAEARQVIAEMEKAKSNSGNTWGQKGQPTADFSLLKFPIYRSLLAELQGK